MGKIEKAQYYYSPFELYDQNNLTLDNKDYPFWTIIIVTVLFILLISFLSVLLDKWITEMIESD
jgi:hypothetical protein